MRSFVPTYQIIRRAGLVIVLSMLLSACAIEGGVPNNAAAPTAVPLGQATRGAATATAAPNNAWTIGLLDQPRSLLPYQASSGAARVAAPITELLFPSPALAYNYGYTTTGVLERIPSLENGDAEIRKFAVYLDAAGSITTTVTEVITQVDQLVVTFHWNPQLRWSDGQPVTADDSLFAYEAARAAPISTDISDRLAQIASYERIDDHTTRATLRPDVASPTYYLSYWAPLPRHLLKGTPPDQIFSGEFARKPIGYGPYALERQSDRELTLVRNQHYAGTPPPAERVTFTFLPSADLLRAGVLNGNLDLAATDRPSPELLATLARDRAQGSLQASYLPSPNWEHVDFNLDVPELQDARIRHAIALGTNRQAMAEALFGGQVPVLHSWVLPGQAEAAPPDQIARYDYNPDEARNLLDQAGFTVAEGSPIRASADGITLTFALLTTEGTPIRQQIAQQFQRDMLAIGIDIQVQALPLEQFIGPDGPLFQRQFDIALFGWTASPDPGGLLLWSCAAIPSPDNNFTGDNFAGWCKRDANRAIREAVTSLDFVQRKAAYLRQQQLWADDLPVLPLFQRLGVVLAAPGISGVQPDGLAPVTWNIGAWKRAAPV